MDTRPDNTENTEDTKKQPPQQQEERILDALVNLKRNEEIPLPSELSENIRAGISLAARTQTHGARTPRTRALIALFSSFISRRAAVAALLLTIGFLGVIYIIMNVNRKSVYFIDGQEYILKTGDTITADAGHTAEIHLADGSTIILHENTRLNARGSIAHGSSRKSSNHKSSNERSSNQKTRSTFYLETGSVSVSATKDHRVLEIETPSGIVRVVGTQFVIHTFTFNSHKNSTDTPAEKIYASAVIVTEGIVEVTNEYGSSDVEAGFRCITINQSAPITQQNSDSNPTALTKQVRKLLNTAREQKDWGRANFLQATLLSLEKTK